MLFWNKKAGAYAGFPLQRLLQLIRGAIEVDCDRRLRGGFRWSCRRRDKAVVELNRAPPNGDGRNEEKNRGSHHRRAIVIRLKPIHDFCHNQKKRTMDDTDFTDDDLGMEIATHRFARVLWTQHTF